MISHLISRVTSTTKLLLGKLSLPKNTVSEELKASLIARQNQARLLELTKPKISRLSQVYPGSIEAASQVVDSHLPKRTI